MFLMFLLHFFGLPSDAPYYCSYCSFFEKPCDLIRAHLVAKIGKRSNGCPHWSACGDTFFFLANLSFQRQFWPNWWTGISVLWSIITVQSINWAEIMFQSLNLAKIIKFTYYCPGNCRFWPKFWPNQLLLSLSAQKCQLFIPMVYIMLCFESVGQVSYL